VPTHNHAFMTSADSQGATVDPGGNLLADGPVAFVAPDPKLTFTTFADNAVHSVGNYVPHNNMMPYVAMTFCIALSGIYPSRP